MLELFWRWNKGTELFVRTSCCALGLAAVLPAAAADAESFCRVEAPVLLATDGITAHVPIACRSDPTEGFVLYPEQRLFVGMSLYSVPNTPGETSIADYFEDAQHIPAVTVDLPPAGTTAKLPIGEVRDGMTHLVVAVWAEEMPCAFLSEEKCYGPVDSQLFPIPVDTWPRPVCDANALRAIGYFSWSQGGDPSGFQAPESIAAVFDDIDCFGGDLLPFGLGVSLKSWRVAPLPVVRD